MNLVVSLIRPELRVDLNPVPLAPPLSVDLDPWKGESREGVVLLIVMDGLGWPLFRQWIDSTHDPIARNWVAAARPITSVFPTTTSAALVSLSTGVPPGRHGLVGYRQFLPRWNLVADMLKMTPFGITQPDTLVDSAWRPEHVSGAPTVFRRGQSACAVTRSAFETSGFTRILYEGAEFCGYFTGADLAGQLVQVLNRPRPPELVIGYWDELDTLQHLRGPSASSALLEVDLLVRRLAYVSAHLDPAARRRVKLVVTADHGQVPSDVEHRIAVEKAPAVAEEMAWPLAGDRRAGYFGAKPGRSEALRNAIEHILPDGGRILSMAEAVEHGLFGPPPFHPEIRERLGDFLVLVPPPWGLSYVPPGLAAPTRYLIGAHGGLDPRELLVPLVAGPLEDLAPSFGSASRQS